MTTQPTTKNEGFTPGPWDLKEMPCGIGCCTVYDVAATYQDDKVPGTRSVAVVNGGNAVWLREGEDIANARLIAASPDLYAACLAARNMIAPVEDPSDKVGHRVLGLLNAALAKAGGAAHV